MGIHLTRPTTVVPPTVLVQKEVRDVLAAQPALTRLARRIVSTAFDASDIERRYTVLDELDLDAGASGGTDVPVFYDHAAGELRSPGTKQRNDVYAEHSRRLYVEAGRAALEGTASVAAADVTHVITVSCTGFYAPGPDFFVARDLGLRPSVERYHLGFMGCYAALPALRMAAQFCRADPDAVVLVVSVELCTLHMRTSNDPDTIVASSLFGDGAAATIVTAREPEERALRIDGFASRTVPDGEGDMAWRIGDSGFEMVLSNAVPSILGENIVDALEPLMAGEPHLSGALSDGAMSQAVQHWVIHPGGRSILDRVESALGLSETQLVPARDTLRDYGNMSSATVLFVLRNILDDPGAVDGERVAAMAFGPGLTVESALLTVTS